MIDRRDVARYRRELNGMLAVAANDDAAAFAQVVALLDDARRRLPAAANQLVGYGYSWADLGRELGVTRAGAHSRFGSHRVRPPTLADDERWVRLRLD